ncbi:MAG: hypothetical protein ABI333_15000 [bacterium]
MRSNTTLVRCLGAALAAGLYVFLGATAAAAPGPEAPDPEPPRTGPGYDKAKVLFKEGIKAFDEGYYTTAVEKFKAAYELYPSAKIHTRIALCYKWLGNMLKALEHYEIFLKKFPKDPPKDGDKALRKRVINVEIPKLLAVIGQLRITISGPAGTDIRIDGKPIGEAPLDRVIRLMPGPVAISATAKGYYAWKKDLMLKRKQSLVVEILLIKIKPKIIRKVITIRAKPIYKRWWFWTTIGALVAGGATAAGVVLGTRERPRELSGTLLRHDGLTYRW